MLHVYGLNRTEAEHVVDSFSVVRKYEERDYGEYRTKRLVLEAYDRMAMAAARGGAGWEPLAMVPAGWGPRHPARVDKRDLESSEIGNARMWLGPEGQDGGPLGG